MSLRKAILWSAFWIALSLLVNLGIYFALGAQKAIEFFTGYLIEKTLSVDNLFVFLIIFTYFDVQPKYQRRVLNYGIIGVIILRGILILIGVRLVTEFTWILYIFGLILIYSGYHISFGTEKKMEPEKNIALRLFKKIIPVATDYQGHRFFIRRNKKEYATPLLLVLIIIESTDVVFAVDSIPAVFAITTDPFIILTSNLMAVLGLRSLYFVLEKVQSLFYYVKYAVGIILVFVGLKMLTAAVIHITTFVSLSIVLSLLIGSIVLSYFKKPAAAE